MVLTLDKISTSYVMEQREYSWADFQDLATVVPLISTMAYLVIGVGGLLGKPNQWKNDAFTSRPSSEAYLKSYFQIFSFFENIDN